MLLFVATEAFAGSGHVALGVQTASGLNPVEPLWLNEHVGPRTVAPPSAVVCAGAVGWWITGGHDYAGPRGEVLRTSDDERWGLSAETCPTTMGSQHVAIGAAYGRQWGGQLYVTAHSTAGISAFAKSTAEHEYQAYAPYAKPELAVGFVVPPGMSFEVGPYALIAPPIVQHADVPTVGAFVGHLGLELNVLIGAGSPQVPWRH